MLQIATFEAVVICVQAEGIIHSTESCHAGRACIDETLRNKVTGEAKTLLFNLSGQGHFDMASYAKYFAGELEDQQYSTEVIRAALANQLKVAETA